MPAIGENILRGIDFAVDEINKAGGVNGQMLEVVRGDHAGDAATGKSEAERLITQEGVNVIMGCHMSVVTEVVAQVCQQYGIPMITAISTLDRLTDEDHKDYDYFFRLCPLNSVYVEDMLKYLQDSKEQTGNEIKKVAIFTDPSFIPNLGASANGVASVVEFNPDLTNGVEINEDFKKVYNVNMNGHSAESYTVVWLFKATIEKAGSTDGAAVRDALAALSIDGAFEGGRKIVLPVLQDRVHPRVRDRRREALPRQHLRFCCYRTGAGSGVEDRMAFRVRIL